jgi:hypothetical protein
MGSKRTELKAFSHQLALTLAIESYEKGGFEQ